MWLTMVLFPDPDGAEKINTLLSMTKILFLFIQCFYCASCVCITTEKYYNHVIKTDYLKSEKNLYVLFEIIKIGEIQWDKLYFKDLISPHLCQFYPKQMACMVKIQKNGDVSFQNYILKRTMSGTFTAMGTYLLKMDNGILLFDGSDDRQFPESHYLLKDNEILTFNNNIDAQMAQLIWKYRNTEYKYRETLLSDWNAQHGCQSGTFNGKIYHDGGCDIIWGDYIVNVTELRRHDSEFREIISISCKGLLDSPVYLVIPSERKHTTYIPPDFVEMPFLIIDKKIPDKEYFKPTRGEFVGYPACNLGKNGHSMFLRVHGTSYGCLVGCH